MSDRERLVEIIGGVQWNAKAEQVADALLAAGVTLPPAPPPVLEVTEDADKAFLAAFDAVAIARGLTTRFLGAGTVDMRAAGLSAAFPHLLEEFFAGLPKDDQCYITLEQFSIGPNTQAALLAAARREA